METYIIKAFVSLFTVCMFLDIFVFGFKYHDEIFGFVCFVALITLCGFGLYLAWSL